MPEGPYISRLSVFNHWSGERTYSYRVMVAQPVGSYDIYARVTAVTISVAGNSVLPGQTFSQPAVTARIAATPRSCIMAYIAASSWSIAAETVLRKSGLS